MTGTQQQTTAPGKRVSFNTGYKEFMEFMLQSPCINKDKDASTVEEDDNNIISPPPQDDHHHYQEEKKDNNDLHHMRGKEEATDKGDATTAADDVITRDKFGIPILENGTHDGNEDVLPPQSRIPQLSRNVKQKSKRRVSAMKVRTQSAALLAMEDERKQRRKSRGTMMREFFRLSEHDENDSNMDRTSRGELLTSTHKQSAVRGFLEDSYAKTHHRHDSPRLRFFDVEIREYAVTASDNPTVRSGTGLELGWEYNVLDRIDLDAFEEKRSTERSNNFKKEKKLTKLERDRLLREFGISKSDMQAAAKQATIIRNARKKSLRVAMNPSKLNNDKIHEKIENGKRKVRKILKRKLSSFGGGNACNSQDIAEVTRRASGYLVMMALMGDEYNEASMHSHRSLNSTGRSGILKNSTSAERLASFDHSSSRVSQ